MNFNKRKKIYTGLLCFAALLPGYKALTQIHTPNLPANKWLVLAEEQYQQDLYANSAQSARKYLDQPHGAAYNSETDARSKAYYLYSASLLKINVPGCTDTAIRIITTTSSPSWKQRTAYALAQYFFHHNQLARAVPYYELAGIANLSNDEIAKEKFELAYCYFNLKKFDKAEPLFASIKELKGKYYNAGNYYYGLLAYNQNSYQEALQSFERIKDDPQYKSIVPYYIAEIYYFTGQREKALAEAVRLTNQKDKLYYDNELHLLAAQCLFEAGRFEDALAYFEYFYEHSDKVRKEDLYEMAYSYYKVSEWESAIEKFKPLSNAHDSLGQTAMYLLGDCYLKAGDKKSARNAFGFCADMAYNPGQQEAALILNAKLSYEMGYNDEAQGRLNTLLTDYPGSSFHDEAKTLMSDLLLKSSNYTEAFKALLDVSSKAGNYWQIYQKVAYGYAMQQLLAGNANEADSLFTLSLSHSKDATYEAAAWFWKGEIAYKGQRYKDAVKDEQKYLDIAGNFLGESRVKYLSPSATFQHAYLNMGYAAMQDNEYAAAQLYFSKAQQGSGLDSASLLAATLREADAVFMQKDYPRATALYDRVIAAHGADLDYAIFQKAILLGLQGKPNDKATLLQSLFTKVPPSKYANGARYELALVYIEEDKYQPAINTLLPLTQSLEHDLASKAWMKIGFAYQESNNSSKAIEAYKHVVTEYPHSDERPAALDALKSLYIESNQPGAYAQLLKENDLPSADKTVLDSTYYASAEALVSSAKWDKAKPALDEYLGQFPNGAFTTKAYYYRGESNFQLRNNKAALADFEAVLARPWSDFSENSARRAAAIAYQDNDFSKALGYYQSLRSMAMGKENIQLAYNGLMKSSFSLGKFDEAALYADTLLALPEVDENTLGEASFYKAKSLQHFNKPDDALNIYKQLANAKNGAVAAEARYHIAEIYLQQNRLKDAEEAANVAIRKSAGYDYWVVSSYILISDIFKQQKDYFNAKATLQSVVKNTKIADLKQEAAKKLEQIKALEKKQSKLSED